jgi:hypothetical protein
MGGLGIPYTPSPELEHEIEESCYQVKDDLEYDIMIPKKEIETGVEQDILHNTFPKGSLESLRARVQLRVFRIMHELSNWRKKKTDSDITQLGQELKQHLRELMAFPGFTLDHILFSIFIGDIPTHILEGVMTDDLPPFSRNILQVYVEVLGNRDGAVILCTLFKILTGSFTCAKEMMCTRLIEGYDEFPRIMSGFVQTFPADQDLKMLFAVTDRTGELLAQYAFHALNDLQTVDPDPTDLNKRKRKLDEVSILSAAVTAYISKETTELERLEKEEEEKERNVRSRQE